MRELSLDEGAFGGRKSESEAGVVNVNVNVDRSKGTTRVSAAGLEGLITAAIDNLGNVREVIGDGSLVFEGSNAIGVEVRKRGSATLGARHAEGIPSALDNVCKKITKGPSGSKKPKNRSRALIKRHQGWAAASNCFSHQNGQAPQQRQGASVLAQKTMEQAWERAAPAPREEQEDFSYLQPWGDILAECAAETTLRVVYQNVAHSFAAMGEDPGISSFTENLVALQAGMAMCSETNVNWKSVQNSLRVRSILQKSFRVQMSTNSSGIGMTAEALAKRKLPGGGQQFLLWTTGLQQ